MPLDAEALKETVQVDVGTPPRKSIVRTRSWEGRTLFIILSICFIVFVLISSLTSQAQQKAITNLRETNDVLINSQIEMIKEQKTMIRDRDLAMIDIHRLKVAVETAKSKPAGGFATVQDSLVEYSVRIRVHNGTQGQGTGSGVLIARNHIVTNYHVIQLGLSTKTVWIDFPRPDGSFVSVVGVIEIVDAARDLAFVRIPEANSAKRWAKLRKTPLAPHSPILAIACGNSHLPLAKSGYFGYRRGDGRYELSIVGFWGDSGGPIYDPATGEVVCLYNEIDAAHFEPTTRSAVHPSIFFGIPSAWVLEVMAANKIEN
jgi:hypothetical protein